MLSGPLVDKFGVRVCLMMSGFIASIGVIICAVATSTFTLLMGLILSGKYFENTCSPGGGHSHMSADLPVS